MKIDKKEEKEILEKVLNSGKGFELTEQGKSLGFDEKKIQLIALNKKNMNSRVDSLSRIIEELKKEEYDYNNIKENFEEYKNKLVNLVEVYKDEPITKIKTSDIKDAVESYKKTMSEYDYDLLNKWVRAVVRINRGLDFNIKNRLNDGSVEELVCYNPKIKSLIDDDLNNYLSLNKLKLATILSVSSTSKKEYEDNIRKNYAEEEHYGSVEARMYEMKEKLEIATNTNIKINSTMQAYVDAYDFSRYGASYEDFYNMIVSFAYKEINDSQGYVWNSITDLINEKEGEIIEKIIKENEDNYYLKEISVTRIIDGIKYSAYSNTLKDCEGINIEEEWKKDGNLHRAGNLPAKKKISHHHIPEETYLDSAYEQYWFEGKKISHVNTTYEEILSKKSLAERQSIGYDVDEDEEEDENIQYSIDKNDIVKRVKEYINSKSKLKVTSNII